MMSDITILTTAGLLASDFISATLITIGTLYLTSVLKIFGGTKLKAPSAMIGIGLMLFTILHEFSEFLYGIDVHGGFPKTLFGSVHLIVFGAIGSIIFLSGCYMLNKRYSEYVRGN